MQRRTERVYTFPLQPVGQAQATSAWQTTRGFFATQWTTQLFRSVVILMLALTTLGSTIGLAAWNGGAPSTSGGGTSGGGGGGTSSSCACPATSRRNGNRICNCPFNDDCGTNPACYNPGGGKIPGACPHCGFG